LTSDGSGVVINKYIGKGQAVKIPAAIQEMPVQQIGEQAFFRSTITSVVIPEGVETIAAGAFYGCNNLSSVTLPESLKAIGTRGRDSGAFQICHKLTTIRIPKGVTYIGPWTFAGTGLTTVTLPPGITTIESGTFSECANLASIVIPEGVVTIGGAAFSECRSLRSVTLPESLERITGRNYSGGEGTFEKCAALATIRIPNGVTYIGSWAFEGSGLTSITLPSGITTIEEWTFANCAKLASIVVPEGVTKIGSGAFRYCTALTSVTLPSTIAELTRTTERNYLTRMDGTNSSFSFLFVMVRDVYGFFKKIHHGVHGVSRRNMWCKTPINTRVLPAALV
jgi:hypothetical protein